MIATISSRAQINTSRSRGFFERVTIDPLVPTLELIVVLDLQNIRVLVLS